MKIEIYVCSLRVYCEAVDSNTELKTILKGGNFTLKLLSWKH
jgi:hypothetical protein